MTNEQLIAENELLKEKLTLAKEMWDDWQEAYNKEKSNHQDTVSYYTKLLSTMTHKTEPQQPVYIDCSAMRAKEEWARKNLPMELYSSITR